MKSVFLLPILIVLVAVISLTVYLPSQVSAEGTASFAYDIFLDGKKIISNKEIEGRIIFKNKTVLLPYISLYRFIINGLYMTHDEVNGIIDVGGKSKYTCLRISTKNKHLVSFVDKPFNGQIRAELSAPVQYHFDRLYAPFLEVLYYAGYDSVVLKKEQKILITKNTKRYSETITGILCFL